MQGPKPSDKSEKNHCRMHNTGFRNTEQWRHDEYRSHWKTCRHPQNVQLPNVYLPNVHLPNVHLPNVQLQNVQVTKRPGYKTSRLQNVQVTKRPGYRMSSLQNVQVC